MRRKHLYIAASLFLLVSLSGCSNTATKPNAKKTSSQATATKPAASNPRVTRANFEKLKPDMKRSELEAILGPCDRPPEKEVFEDLGIDYQSVLDARGFREKIPEVYEHFQHDHLRWRDKNLTILARVSDPLPGPNHPAIACLFVEQALDKPNTTYIDWIFQDRKGHATQVFEPGQPAKIDFEIRHGQHGRAKGSANWTFTRTSG